MLYLLLSIIAVGVLLCSEPGKRILSGATGLLLIGILVILGVLVVTNFATFIDCALTIIGIPIVFLGIRWIVIQIEKRITNPACVREDHILARIIHDTAR